MPRCPPHPSPLSLPLPLPLHPSVCGILQECSDILQMLGVALSYIESAREGFNVMDSGKQRRQHRVTLVHGEHVLGRLEVWTRASSNDPSSSSSDGDHCVYPEHTVSITRSLPPSRLDGRLRQTTLSWPCQDLDLQLQQPVPRQRVLCTGTYQISVSYLHIWLGPTFNDLASSASLEHTKTAPANPPLVKEERGCCLAIGSEERLFLIFLYPFLGYGKEAMPACLPLF